MSDSDLFQENQEGDDTPLREFAKSKGRALPLAMVDRVLGKRLSRFKPDDPICVVMRVKEAEWVPSIAAAVKAATWGTIVSSDTPARERDKQAVDALAALAKGKRVVCVSTPEVLPSLNLMPAADIVVDIDTIELADVRAAIHAATGAWPRGLKRADFLGADLRQVVSAIRPGTTASSCVRRLRALGMQSDFAPLVDAAPMLDQLHGYGEAKAWGERLVADLDRWRAGEIDFGAIQRRIVLAGDPGVGKSTYVRSLARSTRLPLFTSSVGQMFATSAGYLDSIVKAIDVLFASARNAGPSAIVFIDELDGFPSRESLSSRESSWWTPVVNHMLTVLDGALSSAASQLIVVGATNHPNKLDPALVRPGRMDKIVWIGKPDEKALLGIYRQHVGQDLDAESLSGIAAISIGSTGADVVGHVAGARARAREEGRPMQLQDLVDEIVPPSDLSSEDKWRACVHEAGHAFAAWRLGTGVVKSIAVLGGRHGGRMLSERVGASIVSEEGQRRLVIQMLAGRAAEEVLLGVVSGGSGGGEDSDLARASNLIAAAHLSYGLRGKLLHAANPQDALTMAKLSPAAMGLIEAELGEHYGAAVQMVRSNAESIVALARAVMEQRVVSGERMMRILSSPELIGEGRENA